MFYTEQKAKTRTDVLQGIKISRRKLTKVHPRNIPVKFRWNSIILKFRRIFFNEKFTDGRTHDLHDAMAIAPLASDQQS